MQNLFFQSVKGFYFQGIFIQEYNQAALINYWFYLNNIDLLAAIKNLLKKNPKIIGDLVV